MNSPSSTPGYNPPETLVTLIAQVDAVINVDSYGQHVADALDKSTVLVSTTLGQERFPYYLNMVVQELPNARDLPGWGRVKLSTAEWHACEHRYESAWQALEGSTLLTALGQAQHAALNAPAKQLTALRAPQSALRPATPLAPGALGRAIMPPRWQAHYQHIVTLLPTLLTPGAQAIQVGCWAGELTDALAHQLGPQGHLHAIEPRLPAFTLLASYLNQQGAHQVTSYHAFPSPQARVKLPALTPYADSSPLAFGNRQHTTPVPGITLDSLVHPLCQLVVIMPLFSPWRVLATAEQLLQRPPARGRPGALPQLSSAPAALRHANYRTWTFIDPLEYQGWLVAIPAERHLDLPAYFQAKEPL